MQVTFWQMPDMQMPILTQLSTCKYYADIICFTLKKVMPSSIRILYNFFKSYKRWHFNTNSLKTGKILSLLIWFPRFSKQVVSPQRRGKGSVLSEKFGRACSPLPKAYTLFKTKLCDFVDPIWPGEILIPYLRPDPWINTLFQTCFII